MSVKGAPAQVNKLQKKSKQNPKGECKELQVNELQEKSQRNPKEKCIRSSSTNEQTPKEKWTKSKGRVQGAPTLRQVNEIQRTTSVKNSNGWENELQGMSEGTRNDRASRDKSWTPGKALDKYKEGN